MIRSGSTQLWKPGVGAQLDRSHPLAQGLQACWLFHENSGNRLYDLAGNYHFALTGVVARVAEPYGPAIKFDGTSGQGVAPGHPLASATVFTVLLRMRQKLGQINPFGPYLGSEQSFTSGVNINSNDLSLMDFTVGSSKLQPSLPNDMWVHFAFQWSNATGIQRVYTNAIQTINVTGVFQIVPAYANAYIGKASVSQGGYMTDSHLSSMKVYNRFLSAAEIAADYEAPYAMFTPPGTRRFFSLFAAGGGGISIPGGLSIGAGRLSIGV